LIRWQGQGLSINIAINIAAELLSDLDFPDRLSAKIDAAGLRPSDFIFEVTDSSVLKGSSDPLEVLARLRIKGFGLSIDDFGTGHSNIDQLKKFPFSELKIDRSFVQGARNDNLSRAIVDAAVMLGRELNMQLVAEGVETPDDWNFVARHGVDEVQGFYVAKPMPADDFQKWYGENGGVFSAPEGLNSDCDKRQVAHV
ncbi:MAG: EAL domain-containing protein, partial [Aestuariivirgaceae bacterium]